MRQASIILLSEQLSSLLVYGVKNLAVLRILSDHTEASLHNYTEWSMRQASIFWVIIQSKPPYAEWSTRPASIYCVINDTGLGIPSNQSGWPPYTEWLAKQASIYQVINKAGLSILSDQQGSLQEVVWSRCYYMKWRYNTSLPLIYVLIV